MPSASQASALTKANILSTLPLAPQIRPATILPPTIGHLIIQTSMGTSCSTRPSSTLLPNLAIRPPSTHCVVMPPPTTTNLTRPPPSIPTTTTNNNINNTNFTHPSPSISTLKTTPQLKPLVSKQKVIRPSLLAKNNSYQKYNAFNNNQTSQKIKINSGANSTIPKVIFF